VTLDADCRPFSFLRLAHEAIRVASARVVELAEKGDARLLEELDELIEGIELHADQEDRGLYPLMDEAFDNVAVREAYREEHVELHDGNAEVRALVERDASSAVEALRAWAQRSEDHLLHEENVLQPLASKLTEDLPKACRSVQGIIDVADRDRTETWQVAWVARHLYEGRPFGKVAKYVQALQHTNDATQFNRIKATLRGALPDDAWAQLDEKGLLAQGRL
jgi:hemerythrin-like domain-containing protein